MTFRSIAVAGWGEAGFGESEPAGASVGDGDCVVDGVDCSCGCDGVDCGCDGWCGDDFWSRGGEGDGAVGGFGVDVGLGAGSGVDVGLGSDGDSPPIETGVAAPRFVAGAIAAMWLAYRM